MYARPTRRTPIAPQDLRAIFEMLFRGRGRSRGGGGFIGIPPLPPEHGLTGRPVKGTLGGLAGRPVKLPPDWIGIPTPVREPNDGGGFMGIPGGEMPRQGPYPGLNRGRR